MPKLAIIIPCFNEADGIPQLSEKLIPVLQRLRKTHETELIFVDDGSTDGTLAKLQDAFSAVGSVVFLRHPQNRNLGAALRTGAAATFADYLFFLDSDCTYDPTLVFSLLPPLEKGVDLVTASPYHPQGLVEGVPAWRLLLSKSLSLCYRFILRSRLHTFTAMVRGMRQEVFWASATPTNDFTFVTELLIRAINQGYVTQEVPTTLSVRRFGQSKLKVMRTIGKHLALLWSLIVARKFIRYEREDLL